MAIGMVQIGVIHTPYDSSKKPPFQSSAGEEEEEEEFRVKLYPEYAQGLMDLKSFRYIYLLYYLHKVDHSEDRSMTAHPPSLGGREVGLFASRSPRRPNPIGLSVVRLKKIEGNEVFVSCVDAFDGTPLLDIKPYFSSLDSKEDSNMGWLDGVGKDEHLSLMGGGQR
ncbi:MAG: tRNA (N6-threonylcarbamoyladenosine(37)-N6)-methyltransferase TrmO [Thermoplasmata archaeon]|nr:tRNA (N6-threonylcarbamoyladenosine(37)-N6)-methyltransferase TrmO [Thermoplasmata archaeon]